MCSVVVLLLGGRGGGRVAVYFTGLVVFCSGCGGYGCGGDGVGSDGGDGDGDGSSNGGGGGDGGDGGTVDRVISGEFKAKLFASLLGVNCIVHACAIPGPTVSIKPTAGSSDLQPPLPTSSCRRSRLQVMLTMTNKGITPHSMAIDGIIDGFLRIGDVGQAVSFAQHAFNQVPGKRCLASCFKSYTALDGNRVHTVGIPI